MQNTRTCAALADYRRDLYTCFTRSRNALFDLCDALATAQTASSFVHLALAPCYQRRFSSLYQALIDGKIEHAALRRLAVRTAPVLCLGERLLLAVDASTVPRPYARTSPDRMLVQVPAQGPMLPHGGTLTRPGWAYSYLAVVPSTPSAWTHTLDTARIPRDATATTVGAAQLTVLVPLLSVRPLCLADGGYSTGGWLQATAGDFALAIDSNLDELWLLVNDEFRNSLKVTKVSRDQREVVLNSGRSNECIVIANHESSVAEIASNDPKQVGNSSCHGQDSYSTQKRAKDP